MNDSPNAKPKFKSWLIWGLATSFFLLGYVARVAPGVMVPQIAQEFAVSAFALGGLSAFFYYAYLPMQVPSGILIDRFGTRYLLLLSILVVAAACLIFSTTHNIQVAYICRFAVGFGCTFSFIGAIKLATTWFPSRYLGILAGSTQAAGMFGAVVGGFPVAFAVTTLGWRHTMSLIAIAFFILLTLVFLLVRDKPKTSFTTNDNATNTDTENKPKKIPLIEGLIIIASNPQNWINFVCAAALFAPIAAFGEFWGTSCLQQIYNIPKETASIGMGVLFIGWTIGSLLIGLISDLIGKRRPVMIASGLLSFIFLCAVFYLPHLPVSGMFIFIFLFGITNPALVISYTLAAEVNPRQIAATATAFINMAAVIFGVIGQPLIGLILDLNWKGKVINGMHYYSASDFRIAMLILPACIIVGFITAFFIKETYCKSVTYEKIREQILSESEEPETATVLENA